VGLLALATGLGWPFIVRFLVEGMKASGRAPGPEKTEGRQGR
jgi:hypothetical protein